MYMQNLTFIYKSYFTFEMDRRGRRSLQKLVHIEMCPYLLDKSKFEIRPQKGNKKSTSFEVLFSGVSNGIRTHGLQGHNLAL